MAAYNVSRAVAELLDEHKDSPPSFAVQLYPEHWTLNGGPKFLYTNQTAVCIARLWRTVDSLLHTSVYSTRFVRKGYPQTFWNYLTLLRYLSMMVGNLQPLWTPPLICCVPTRVYDRRTPRPPASEGQGPRITRSEAVESRSQSYARVPLGRHLHA